MKNVIRNTLVICLGVGLMGCEWQGGGEGNSWNSRYNFVNFSGSYRGAGGYLVTQYTTAVGGGGGTSGGINVVDENKGTTSAGLSFGGRTSFTPVKPGSFRLLLNGGAAGQFVDNGSGGLTGFYLNGVNFTTVGSINYDNGTYGISAAGAVPIPGGYAISVNYTIQTTASATPSVPSGSSPGGTVKIYVFNVSQEGNKLQIVDNNGSTYQGSFGSIRSSGGSDQDSTFASYANGEQIMGQFEAKGRSAANVNVKMVGTFQATVAGVVTATDGTTTSMQLSDRRILGTWIESNGKTGDINGQAAPVSVAPAAPPTL